MRGGAWYIVHVHGVRLYNVHVCCSAFCGFGATLIESSSVIRGEPKQAPNTQETGYWDWNSEIKSVWMVHHGQYTADATSKGSPCMMITPP